MDLNYQQLINQIGEIVQYCLPIGILIGLIERLCNIVIKAATGRSGD